MSLSILFDALNLEADAADLRVQASILKIKGSEYPSRTAANEDIQLHHASLTTPKRPIFFDDDDLAIEDLYELPLLSRETAAVHTPN